MLRKAMALLLMVTMYSVVSAKPVFDFATGEGFVDKQDILTALGTTQYNAEDLVFVLKQTVTLTADCRLETLVETSNQSASVEMIVNSKATQGGIELTGYGVSSEPGSLPVAGRSCYAKNFQGTWTNLRKIVRIKTLSVNDKLLLKK